MSEITVLDSQAAEVGYRAPNGHIHRQSGRAVLAFARVSATCSKARGDLPNCRKKAPASDDDSTSSPEKSGWAPHNSAMAPSCLRGRDWCRDAVGQSALTAVQVPSQSPLPAETEISPWPANCCRVPLAVSLWPGMLP